MGKLCSYGTCNSDSRYKNKNGNILLTLRQKTTFPTDLFALLQSYIMAIDAISVPATFLSPLQDKIS